MAKFSGASGDREKMCFPVQLTTSRIVNLTRLIFTLAILYVMMMTIHTYIHIDNTVNTTTVGPGVLKRRGIELAEVNHADCWNLKPSPR